MTTTAQASSIDPAELAYYERLASTWWDLEGPFWPLHRLNGLRVQYIATLLRAEYARATRHSDSLAGLTLVDVGCGGGILTEALASRGANVHGIDVLERNIHIARLHASQTGSSARYSVSSAEALAEQGVQYDAVLAMEVVEHVADLPSFIKACTQLVRPEGLLFIATINRTIASWVTAIIGAEYVLRWLPRGTHRWRKFPKPRELEALTAREGLHLVDRCGVRINPFTRQFSLTRFVGVNYMLALKKSQLGSNR